MSCQVSFATVSWSADPPIKSLSSMSRLTLHCSFLINVEFGLLPSVRVAINTFSKCRNIMSRNKMLNILRQDTPVSHINKRLIQQSNKRWNFSLGLVSQGHSTSFNFSSIHSPHRKWVSCIARLLSSSVCFSSPLPYAALPLSNCLFQCALHPSLWFLCEI